MALILSEMSCSCSLFFGAGGCNYHLLKKKMCLLGGNHGKPASVLLSSLLCSSSLGKVESWALCKLHHLLNIRETDTPCSFPPYLWPHQSERKWKCWSLSQVWLSATPWTHQAPLSMEFSRQEYWSRLPFSSPEELPNPGMKLTLTGGFFTSEPPGKPRKKWMKVIHTNLA